MAAFPARLEVRNALSAETLGVLPLGEQAVARYGAAYATVARADLHALLVQSVRALKPDAIRLNARVASCSQGPDGVYLRLQDSVQVQGDVLVGADGVHSAIRNTLFGASAANFTGNGSGHSLRCPRALPIRRRQAGQANSKVI